MEKQMLTASGNREKGLSELFTTDLKFISIVFLKEKGSLTNILCSVCVSKREK